MARELAAWWAWELRAKIFMKEIAIENFLSSQIDKTSGTRYANVLVLFDGTLRPVDILVLDNPRMEQRH